MMKRPRELLMRRGPSSSFREAKVRNAVVKFKKAEAKMENVAENADLQRRRVCSRRASSNFIGVNMMKAGENIKKVGENIKKVGANIKKAVVNASLRVTKIVSREAEFNCIVDTFRTVGANINSSVATICIDLTNVCFREANTRSNGANIIRNVVTTTFG